MLLQMLECQYLLILTSHIPFKILSIYEKPNPLEELVSVVGLTLLFALFSRVVYINVLSHISYSFCLRVLSCIYICSCSVVYFILFYFCVLMLFD